MQRSGVARGDRVLIALDNSLACVVAFYGALRADLVPCLIGTGLRPARLSRLIGRARPALIVCDERRAPGMRAEFAGPLIEDLLIAAREQPSTPGARRAIDLDLATICFTSGSTGEPKGVMLSHHNLMNSCAAICAYLEQHSGDVILSVLPLSHTYGLFQMLAAFAQGGTLVLERGFGLAWPLVEAMQRERVTGFAGVPTIFASLLTLKNLAAADLSSLRYLTNAAAPLPKDQVVRLCQALPGVRFFAMYGQSECTRVAYLPPAEAIARAGSVGISMPNQEAWLELPDGTRAGVGEVGELCVRGSNVMRGYFEDPEATQRALRPGSLPGEVVLHTGDLFRLDADGYLHFVSRSDDVIKSRGEKVSPSEVEAVVAGVPGVAEVAVVGVPDAVLGTAVKAIVVPEPGATPSLDEIRRRVLEQIGDAAVPKQIELCEALPRTASGKVHKAELR